MRLKTDLADAIVEELTDKLSFHRHLPYKLIRCFVGEQDPNRVSQARAYVADCTSEYDELVQAGKGPKLHRVAHRVLDPSTQCRQ